MDVLSNEVTRMNITAHDRKVLTYDVVLKFSPRALS